MMSLVKLALFISAYVGGRVFVAAAFRMPSSRILRRGLPSSSSPFPSTAATTIADHSNAPESRRIVARAASAQKESFPVYTNFDKSRQIFQEAQEFIPGGVNSPVRSFKSVGGQPIVFDHVKGAYIWDVDGNKFTDYVCSWGPAIAGHANDEVLVALRVAMAKGTSFGAPGPLENELAKTIVSAIPSIEMVRFTSSGTEACMGAIRVARAFTGREGIIKFDGCYHGHSDGLLVKAGSGVATLGLPDSKGIPVSATRNTFTARYNDLASVEAILKAQSTKPQADQIAAVIIEPIVGNAGYIEPTKEFIVGLRELTKKYGALLIFDEVMTGFRVAYGGAQELFGIVPDLTTLGKVIGGGLPVGAFGGRRDIMRCLAPVGPVYQAGTLSGNPLAMAAGLSTLAILRRPGNYDYLRNITSRLVNGIIERARKHGHDAHGGSQGGMFGFFFSSKEVKCNDDTKLADEKKFCEWHRMMLERGIYLAPSMHEASFTSLAHTEADIDHTLAVADEVLSLLKK